VSLDKSPKRKKNKTRGQKRALRWGEETMRKREKKKTDAGESETQQLVIPVDNKDKDFPLLGNRRVAAPVP